MKSLKKLFFTLGAAVILFWAGALWLADKYAVPVLMYHHVEDSDILKADTVSPRNLEKQILYLKNHGYRILTLEELANGLRAGRRFPYRSVALTFDDGNENNFTNAFPVLQKYGVPATFFVSPDCWQKKGFMSLNQMLMMRKGGASFGSHGMTQAYLPSIPVQEQFYEVLESKRVLEGGLGQRIDFFAYPIGGFNEEVKALVHNAGYKAAFTTNRGSDRFDKDLYEINRIRLSDRDTSELVLWVKTSGYYNLFRKLKKAY